MQEHGPGGHQSEADRAAGAGLGTLACCTPCARLVDSMLEPTLFRWSPSD